MTVVFSDTFTDTDGVKPGSHTPTTGSSYSVIDYTLINTHTAEIHTNRLRTMNPTFGAFYRWKLNPASAFTADHTIAFNYGANISQTGFADIRFQTRFQGTSERYEFRLLYDNNVSSLTVLAEIRHVTSGGTVTTLATTTFAPSQYANEPFVCSLSGSALQITRNGSNLLSTTDSTIASAGDVNLRVGVNNGLDSARLDDLVITNTAGGGSAKFRPYFITG
jgi:hypothetical protein